MYCGAQQDQSLPFLKFKDTNSKDLDALDITCGIVECTICLFFISFCELLVYFRNNLFVRLNLDTITVL